MRSVFLSWALIISPIIAWYVGAIWVGGTDYQVLAGSLLFGLPALLTVVGGIITRRGIGEIVLVAVVSSGLAGLGWVLTIAFLVP